MTNENNNPDLQDLANKIIKTRQAHSYTANLKAETVALLKEIIDFFDAVFG